MKRRSGSFALSIVVSAVGVFLVLPTIITVPMSFSSAELLVFPPPGFSTRWYETYVSDPRWQEATLNSVIVAMVSTALATSFGTLAALGLARGRVPFRGVLTTLFLTPMIVPTIVTAVAMYRVFAGLGLTGTVLGLALAHAILGLPFVVINVSAVLQKIDWRVEQAARSLGADPARAFLFVTFPLILPGVAAGALFAFLTSFDEIVVALFLSGVSAVTLPVQMWSGIRFEINPTVAAASVILVVVSSLVFILFALVRKESNEQSRP